jgi:hypothetical protein
MKDKLLNKNIIVISCFGIIIALLIVVFIMISFERKEKIRAKAQDVEEQYLKQKYLLKSEKFYNRRTAILKDVFKQRVSNLVNVKTDEAAIELSLNLISNMLEEFPSVKILSKKPLPVSKIMDNFYDISVELTVQCDIEIFSKMLYYIDNNEHNLKTVSLEIQNKDSNLPCYIVCVSMMYKKNN